MLRPERRPASSEDHWLSVSDLMAGLMVIFLFIAVLYIRPIVSIATTLEETENLLYTKLAEEFRDDLPKWNAEINRGTLAIRFREPSVLFDVGATTLKPAFTAILADFFPRYLRVLAEFKATVEEVRIEGHTSTEWEPGASADQAYFSNMALSQGRTRSVLQYCLGLTAVEQQKSWARDIITANGLSSSRLIRSADGREDPVTSRRVEFRVRTNAKEQIDRMVRLIR